MLFLSSTSFSLSVSFYFASVWLFPPDPPLFYRSPTFLSQTGACTALLTSCYYFLLPPTLSLSLSERTDLLSLWWWRWFSSLVFYIPSASPRPFSAVCSWTVFLFKGTLAMWRLVLKFAACVRAYTCTHLLLAEDWDCLTSFFSVRDLRPLALCRTVTSDLDVSSLMICFTTNFSL